MSKVSLFEDHLSKKSKARIHIVDSNVETMCVSESNEQGELRSLFAVKLRSVCSDQMAPPNVIFFSPF